MASQSEIFARYRSLYDSSSIKTSESDTNKKINNLSFVDFLFEIVKATKGQNEFKNVVLKGSLSEVKKTDEINNVIKQVFKETFGCDSNLIIPGKYTTESVNGISISKSEIDLFGLFAFDPEGTPGKFLYEGNDISKHVNFFLYKSQFVSSSSPITFNVNGNILFSVYAQDSSTLSFQFGATYKNAKFGDWLSDYLDAASPILIFTNFFAILTDLITGSLSLSGGKSALEMGQQSTLLSALEKIFGFCNETPDNSNPNGSLSGFLNNQNNGINTSNQNNGNGLNTGFGSTQTTGLSNDIYGNVADFFNFDSVTLDDINTTAQLKSTGFVRFSTCGNLDVAVNPNDVISGLEKLFNNSDNSNIFDYSNNSGINALLINGANLSAAQSATAKSLNTIDNASINPNIDNATDFLTTVPLSNGLSDLLNSGESTITTNLSNINLEFQLNILKAIPYAFMEMVLSPKVFLIPKLHSVLSGNDSTKDGNSIINALAPLITSIGDSLTKKILNNIFDSIKSDLIKLAKDLAVNFLKQRGLDYLACLSSLLSLLNLLGSLFQDGGCSSILDKLLKLLQLSNFGPMPPIPPPLILVGGALKPGLNQVSIVNDVKASLEEKGIVTSPTMPDGTPNNMMIAIEETIKTIIQHIKTNANISVTTLGTGLSQGYGQIQ